ncbi:hypothetical protein Rhopal_006699-T1 [Rhodotorula paludigena]|uniref:Deacetylase sirtuin-type domain-containing protein n=1 Tax=Rhodotorula paludigena TaxID=86838 RepID=A0AAV5GWE6_9BASI|nr:hypothetical protein Rhopal_006699-T1 [Rhodotorula paludigena]
MPRSHPRPAPPRSSSPDAPALAVVSFGDQVPPLTADNAPPFPIHHAHHPAPATTAPSPSPAPSSSLDLSHVARHVLKAKRIAVVCGAGISTASGIPDFRSSAGLFESLKKQHPDARLSSGKDLFDVGLFASEQNASIFYGMIAELKKQADAVEPTAFHSWLKHLDDDGKLFRVYTQNIDALEEKAGLTYGLGDKSLPLPPRRAPRSPSKPSAASRAPTPRSAALQPSSSQLSVASSVASTSAPSSTYPTPRPSTSPPPAAATATHSAIPRVIPLHGHLSTLSCSHCKHVVATSPYLDLLSSGSAPLCPGCLKTDSVRAAAGERSRGVGVLRPDVVLYGEEHKDGERVGEITQRDLMGQRPDLLLVVGTTLKVKGTKRLVRELAKVIKPAPKPSAPPSDDDDAPSSSQPSRAPTTSATKKPPPVHTIYLNYDFPTPSREWAGVFDCWLRGDIQQFVAVVAAERARLAQEQAAREERKRAREERKRERRDAAAGLQSPVKKKDAREAQEEKENERARRAEERSRGKEARAAGGAASPAASPSKKRRRVEAPPPPAAMVSTLPAHALLPPLPPSTVSSAAQQQQPLSRPRSAAAAAAGPALGATSSSHSFTLELPAPRSAAPTTTTSSSSSAPVSTAAAAAALKLPPPAHPASVAAHLVPRRSASSSSLSALSSEEDDAEPGATGTIAASRRVLTVRRASPSPSPSPSASPASSASSASRRSSRASTASATHASLSRASSSKQQGQGQQQTRLGFQVTKKSVGSVTGTTTSKPKGDGQKKKKASPLPVPPVRRRSSRAASG